MDNWNLFVCVASDTRHYQAIRQPPKMWSWKELEYVATSFTGTGWTDSKKHCHLGLSLNIHLSPRADQETPYPTCENSSCEAASA